MNLPRILSFATLLLAASLTAHAQTSSRRRIGDVPDAAPLSATTLSTNYRLKLEAKSGDKSLGQISLLTCSKHIDASGMLDKPADDSLPASILSLNGMLAEEEGGALLLSYGFVVSTPVVSQTMSSPASAIAKPKEADGKEGDAKPEPRTHVTRIISFRESSSKGTVRMKAGNTYELVSMSGVVYSLTISPEPLK